MENVVVVTTPRNQEMAAALRFGGVAARGASVAARGASMAARGGSFSRAFRMYRAPLTKHAPRGTMLRPKISRGASRAARGAPKYRVPSEARRFNSNTQPRRFNTTEAGRTPGKPLRPNGTGANVEFERGMAPGERGAADLTEVKMELEGKGVGNDPRSSNINAVTELATDSKAPAVGDNPSNVRGAMDVVERTRMPESKASAARPPERITMEETKTHTERVYMEEMERTIQALAERKKLGESGIVARWRRFFDKLVDKPNTSFEKVFTPGDLAGASAEEITTLREMWVGGAPGEEGSALLEGVDYGVAPSSSSSGIRAGEFVPRFEMNPRNLNLFETPPVEPARAQPGGGGYNRTISSAFNAGEAKNVPPGEWPSYHAAPGGTPFPEENMVRPGPGSVYPVPDMASPPRGSLRAGIRPMPAPPAGFQYGPSGALEPIPRGPPGAPARPSPPYRPNWPSPVAYADRPLVGPGFRGRGLMGWNRLVRNAMLRGGRAVNEAVFRRLDAIIDRLGGGRNIFKTAVKLAGAGASVVAIIKGIQVWLASEASKAVDAPTAAGGGKSTGGEESITPHSPDEVTTNPPFTPTESTPGMNPQAGYAASILADHKEKTSALLAAYNNSRRPSMGVSSGARLSLSSMQPPPGTQLPTPPKPGKPIVTSGLARTYGPENPYVEMAGAPPKENEWNKNPATYIAGTGADLWDFVMNGVDLPKRTLLGEKLTDPILIGTTALSGDPRATEDIWKYTRTSRVNAPPNMDARWAEYESNFGYPEEGEGELDPSTGANLMYDEEGNTEVDMDVPVGDPEDEFDVDFEDLMNKIEAEVLTNTGGTSRSEAGPYSLNGSVKNVYAPFAPLGSGDSLNVKSAPIYATNNVTDMELAYRDGIKASMPLEGDALSEKKNDPRGRKLQTSIETLNGVENADIFHPNIYYEPAVDPKAAYYNHAKAKVKNVDDATQPYSWEWQDPALRKNNRDSEVFVPFTYDTSNNTSLPAQADPYTVSDEVPRPYTPTEPRMGPQLYDAPQLVGIGFDERNPPPDPFTTTHSTSTVTSTTGAGLKITGGAKKRNIDELDKNSNPAPIQNESLKRDVNPPNVTVLGEPALKVQRRRRDLFNSANQTTPWTGHPTWKAPAEAIPANIGRSL